MPQPAAQNGRDPRQHSQSEEGQKRDEHPFPALPSANSALSYVLRK